MTRLLATLVAVVSWVGPSFAEPSVYLKNMNVVSYAVKVDASPECKVDKANLETSLRFLANASRLKLISATTFAEEMPTLSFQIIAIGTGITCAANVEVMLLAPTSTATLKANNIELSGPRVLLWSAGYLLMGQPSEFSAHVIAKAEQFLKEFVNDWSASL
jgi:hypothetical protein